MKPDSELDREISALLNVDPSPEFTAKVRRQIENAPAPAWRFGWTVFAAGAMAAAIVLAVVLSRPMHREVTRPEPPQTLPNISMLSNVPEVKAALKAPVPAAPKPAAITKEPEFFISPGEAAAIQRLLRFGSNPQVEIPVVTIEPQPLPETRLTPTTFTELVPNEPPMPVVTPKGDIQ